MRKFYSTRNSRVSEPKRIVPIFISVIIRKFFFYLHLVVGLVAAIVLIALGLTGGILVFENEIHYALNAKLYKVQPKGERLPLNALSERLEKAHPGTKVAALTLPVDDTIATTVSLRPLGPGKGVTVNVDPYTGAELGSPDAANQLMRNLHQFHTKLLLGDKGKWITGIGAILLMVQAISGIVLWWSQKLTRFTGTASGSRKNFEVHNILGIYSSVFMLLFGLTGVVIHWDNQAQKLVNRLAHTPENPPIPKPATPARGAVPLTADQIMDVALKTAPGAKVTFIQGIGSLRNPINVKMRYPEDRTPAGRTTLVIDPTRGEVLYAETSRTGPAGLRVVKLWNREIHTGDIFGWPSRIVACAAAWSLPLLALTGFLIWLGKLRRKRAVTAPVA